MVGSGAGTTRPHQVRREPLAERQRFAHVAPGQPALQRRGQQQRGVLLGQSGEPLGRQERLHRGQCLADVPVAGERARGDVGTDLGLGQAPDLGPVHDVRLGSDAGR